MPADRTAGRASITSLPANRLESVHEVSLGMEAMTVTSNLATGLSVDFSYNTRELRAPGWELAAGQMFMNDPHVQKLLKQQGIDPAAVRKQIEQQYGQPHSNDLNYADPTTNQGFTIRGTTLESLSQPDISTPGMPKGELQPEQAARRHPVLHMNR